MTSEALPGWASRPAPCRQRQLLKTLLLAAVVGVHLGAFTLLVPARADVGRITPVLLHPVRVRLLDGRPSTIAQAPSLAADRTSLPAPLPTTPEALMPEGRLDVLPENYVAASDRYFPVAELGQRPTGITLPSLDSLLVSPLAHGTVVLRLYINETGSVDRIEVADSTAPAEFLVKLLALRQQMQFTPGMRNGANVKSLVTYAVDLAPVEVTTLVSSAGVPTP